MRSVPVEKVVATLYKLARSVEPVIAGRDEAYSFNINL